MEIKKGQQRIVLVLPRLNIVIKFPIIYLNAAVANSFYLFRDVIRIRDKEAIKERLKIEFLATLDSSMITSILGSLFGGILVNWKEFKFYWKTKNSLLQPTYFSFLGIFNIQRYGKLCQSRPVDLWCQLRKLTNNEVFKDSHHFDNPNNFCVDNGRLKMLDYGNNKCQLVIMLYGEKISEFFNPMHRCDGSKECSEMPALL